MLGAFTRLSQQRSRQMANKLVLLYLMLPHLLFCAGGGVYRLCLRGLQPRAARGTVRGCTDGAELVAYRLRLSFLLLHQTMKTSRPGFGVCAAT